MFFFQEKCSRNRTSVFHLHHMSNYPAGIILFHENSPGAVTGFQLSHLQLSSLLWRFALGEREKELFWMETGRKIMPGAAHPLPWKPKNGMCTEIPSPAGNLGRLIPNEIGRVCSCSSPLPGFELWLLVSHWGHCPSGGTQWSPECLHVWILHIQSMGFFLHGVLGSALNPGFSGCRRSLSAPWAEPVEQSRAGCAIPAMAVGMAVWERSDWICSRSWECLPRGAVLLCPVGCGTRSLQDVPGVFYPSSPPVPIPDGVFRPV